jgi:hypothetical protein
MSRPALELADIFRRYGPAYRQRHPLPLAQLKLMRAVETCRTAVLGGHVDKCGHCDHLRVSYNSCRNRHCPKCQSLARARWLEQRKSELLPVSYFHLVFTLPPPLAAIAWQNKKVVYGILFRASAEALLRLARDPKHLGAEIGFFSILHTWGQNLLHHPHVHTVVAGGGLSPNRQQWISCRPGFFLPVRVLSRLFRRLFLDHLQQAFQAQQLAFFSELAVYAAPDAFARLIATLNTIDWVVYAKPPFGGPANVLEYLGRYTHRVALSNDRLLAADPHQVSFRWKDYRHQQRRRVMTLSTDEFIRRFLLHSLPPGFQRIRHYGLLANSNRRQALDLCRRLLALPAADWLPLPAAQSVSEMFRLLTGQSLLRCPQCGSDAMLTFLELVPLYRKPLDSS